MAKGQTLASNLPELKGDFKLPSVLDSAPTPMIDSFNSPYVTFAHPKRSDEWSKVRAVHPAVEEGDIFLVEKVPTYLPQIKLTMMAYRQLWVHSNDSGSIILAVSKQEEPHPFKERIESVVLVYLEDRVVPATMTFKTTKCGAAHSLSDALLEAATEDWAKKSQAHAETLVAQKPFMRYFGLVRLGPQRTGKKTGLPYVPAEATISPTSVPEWKALGKAFQDPKFSEVLNSVTSRYESRVKELLDKVS